MTLSFECPLCGAKEMLRDGEYDKCKYCGARFAHKESDSSAALVLPA